MTPLRRIGETWRSAARHIDRQEARRLLEHVSGCTHADLIADPARPMSETQAVRFDRLVARRVAGEPLAYLLGTAWFAGLEFVVTPDVLIPRPESEVLVDRGVDSVKGCSAPRIVDLGTGSGIIAILLAKRLPGALVTATDLSPGALAVARTNAERHAAPLRFLQGDWLSPLAGERFDLIVANPPYIAVGDPHLGQNGLPCEPPGALSDGEPGGDGTACLRKIVAGAGGHLSRGGWLLMEHGYDQAVKVRAMLAAAGFSGVLSWRDEAGIERVSGGMWCHTPDDGDAVCQVQSQAPRGLR